MIAYSKYIPLLAFLAIVNPGRGDTTPTRSFAFTYAATVTGLEANAAARIWLPVASSDLNQHGDIVARNFPAACQTHTDADTGNTYLYFAASANSAGVIPFSITYRVTRREVAETPSKEGDDPHSPYLQPNRMICIGGKPLKLISGRSLPADSYELGRFLYGIVDDHVQYRKDKPGWGRGDAAWACDSGFGNCTDFHSLFISLARSEKLPAKFTIGFQLPREKRSGTIPGYHCWASFFAKEHGWVPVDISEANQHPDKRDYYFGHLDADRIAFTTGRDLSLIPKQDGPPLNFFVYPYVEVNGKPLPQSQVQNQFSYDDAPAHADPK